MHLVEQMLPGEKDSKHHFTHAAFRRYVNVLSDAGINDPTNDGREHYKEIEIVRL